MVAVLGARRPVHRFGSDSLVTGDSTFQRLGGFGMLTFVAPAQFLTAYRRHKGIPLTTPLRFGSRSRQQ